MNALLIALPLATLAALGWWWWRGRQDDAPPAPRAERREPEAPTRTVTITRTLPPGAKSAPAPLPPELAAFQPLSVDQWGGDLRARYVRAFRDVPRPPRLMQQLLSSDFVQGASTAQLVDLIQAEPLFAAKLLGAVNSPLYGLSRRVAAIDQAVMILGLETVRSICLQYMMISSFKADSRERQRLLDDTWTACALASEITQRLSRSLHLDDRGATVSAVALSFLGRVATVALTPMGVLQRIPARDLLARKDAEQKVLGLAASEIGRLLMIDWGLPDAAIDDACELDSVLTLPRARLDATRATRQAVGYVASRLGERLAHGELQGLAGFDLRKDPGVELWHLKGHLAHPSLARLPQRLHETELVDAVERMRSAALAPA